MTTKTATRKPASTTTTTKPPATLPVPPLLATAPAFDVDEPLVLSKPPTGKSGDLKVRKALKDAIERDPRSVHPRVFRLSAAFGQGVEGTRFVTLRADLDDEFPTVAEGQPEAVMVRELGVVQRAGAARCAAVLGAGFNVLSVFFGGKKLR